MSSSSKHPIREPQFSSSAGTTMAGESVEKTTGGCPVTLESWYMGNPTQARVPATDQTGDPCALSLVEFSPIEDLRPCRRASTWSDVFPPELARLPMPITEFPEWIKEIQPRKPPMMQSLPTPSCQGVEPIAMAHVLPPHRQLDIRSPANTIQELNQQPHTDPQPRPASPQPPPPQGRKRKKVEGGEPTTPTEPRRGRRLIEACARCRSKKIKVRISHNVILPP